MAHSVLGNSAIKQRILTLKNLYSFIRGFI